MLFTNVKRKSKGEGRVLVCELALAVRLFIMAARKIWKDVVEMLTYCTGPH